MQNLAPGRPGVIRPQVGQALGSTVFPAPAGGPAGAEAGGCFAATRAGGFGGAVGVGGVVGLDTPPAMPGTGGLVVGTGGFGALAGKPVAATGVLGGGFAATGTGGFGGAAPADTGTGSFSDVVGVGNGAFGGVAIGD
jgi:hypothetical protein